MIPGLLVALALAVEPAGRTFPQALDAVQRACRHEQPFRLQGLLGVRSACEAVLEREAPATRALLERRVARLQRLSPGAASAVVDALLAFGALPLQGPPDYAEARAVSEAFAGAARASRGELAVVADFAEFTSWRLPDDGTWLAALESNPDPVGLAKRFLALGRAPPDPIQSLVRGLEHRHPASPWDATARALVVARTRGRLDPVVGGPRFSYCTDSAVDLAILERLDGEHAPPSDVSDVAAALLASRPVLAARTYDALSVPARNAAFSRLGEGRSFVAAINLLAGGAPGGALELARRSGAMPKGDSALVRGLAGAEPVDPFDLFLAVRMSTRQYTSGNELVQLLVGRRLEAKRPDLARSLLEYLVGHPPGRCEVEVSVRTLLPSHTARAEAAEAAYVASASEVLGALPPGTTAVPPPQDDPVSATVARLLASSPRSPFVEQALPELPGARGREPAWAAAGETLLPEGWEPVRVERNGRDVRAIALAQDLDPTGEVSGGGYWLLRGDGSGAWRSTYLGLRAFRPYEVAPTSRVALLTDGVVRLQVRRRPLDDTSITFPPLRLRAESSGDPVLVTARLEDLERDTDGDGLSDLVEDRILTAPDDPDTDRDGISDGDDPLPLVPAGVRDPMADMFEVALAGMRGSMAPIRTPPDEPGGAPGRPTDPFRRMQVAPLQPTAAFVESERTAWRGVRASRRTIVLTPAEFERARARFGAFYPLGVRELLRSDDGKRVYLRWDEHWRGGELVLEHGSSGWKVVRSSEWIS